MRADLIEVLPPAPDVPKRARFGRRRHGGRRVWNAKEWERGACGLSVLGSFLQAFSAQELRRAGRRRVGACCPT